jgi:fumarate reductase subunit C
MRTYLLFDATGIVYILVGLVAMRVAWALAAGPEQWEALLENFARPGYVILHVVALVSAIFVGVRFFRLFPKAQPARIGPAKPPPAPLIHAALYVVWAGATLLLVAVLGGIVP